MKLKGKEVKTFGNKRLIKVWLVMGAIGVVFGAGVVTQGEVFAYSATMTTSGNKSIDASAAGNGVTIGSDAITVTTNCKAGYNLTMSTSVNNNNLYLNGDIANNATGTYFTPADGITTLGNSTNTWGYYYNRSSNTVPTKTSVFSAVPALGSTVALVTPSSSASSTDINDSFNVYYGVSVNTNLAAGTYKMIPKTDNGNDNGAITYYLTMADACVPYTVQFNPTSTKGGTTLTGTGTMQAQEFYKDTAQTLTANGFTAPSGYEFKEWNTAQDGTGIVYTDQQSVTNLTTPGNTIILYAQWEALCPAGNICYKDNGANSATKMGDQNIGTSATEATLWASNFQRSGYGFLGWSTKANPTIGTDTIYGPMETISNINVSQGGIKLYAVWKAAETTTVGETTTPVYLQDWDGCNNLTAATYNSTTGKITVTQNSFIALTDKRDDQVYAIAKLADGACWMIENLRLNTTGSNDGTKAQGFGGVFSGLAKAESANFSSSTTANSLYSTTNITGSNQGYRFPRYNNKNTNSPVANMTSTSDNIYSYGNYYTWAAAIANTNDYTGPEVEVNDKTSETANTSICPSGWRLPYGRDTGNGTASGGFYNLNYRINDNSNVTDATASKNLRAYPNNFVYSGYFRSSSANYRGSSGRYWSSTASNSSNAYSLGFDSSGVNPGTRSRNKYSGFSVRCVLGSRSSASQE